MHLERSNADDTADTAHERSAFSRSVGLPAHMGKATAVVKTLVPDSVKDDLIRRGRELGMSESELVRHWVLVHLYGHETVATMDRKRFEMASEIGTNKEGFA